MTRIPKIHIEGAIYYVTSRGDNNCEIFTDAADYSMYLELLKKYQGQYGFQLYVYCLLPNHLHLLIELKTGLTISEIMHDLSSNYTKYFNAKHDRKGHLFQERYKMVLAEKEKYLAPIAEYIYQNPGKLGLCKNAEEYKYSMIQGIASAPAAPRNDVIARTARSEATKQDEAISKPQVTEELVKALAHQAILGSDEFLKKVETILAEQPEARHIEPENPWHKRFILAGSISILVLGFFTVYIYTASLHKEAELKNTLQAEEVKKNKLLQNLDQKYQKEMDAYYKDIAKRLQIEKQKAKALQDRLSGEAK